MLIQFVFVSSGFEFDKSDRL